MVLFAEVTVVRNPLRRLQPHFRKHSKWRRSHRGLWRISSFSKCRSGEKILWSIRHHCRRKNVSDCRSDLMKIGKFKMNASIKVKVGYLEKSTIAVGDTVLPTCKGSNSNLETLKLIFSFCVAPSYLRALIK